MSDINHIKKNHKHLEALVVDNPDLEQLEAHLEQFNIFEALGAVNVELRHSDFLAFLLNPNQNHGLGDYFVKQFLQKALSNAYVSQLPFTPIDLDIWDLDNVIVHRERHNIDILLLDDENKVAVIIENKVISAEHGDQLTRYREIAEQYYPDYRKLFLFLTPEGEEPSDPEYIPIDYGLIVALIEKLLEARASTLGPDVLTLTTHYAVMLRRHIVDESEIKRLCEQIYRKHQRALDLIYEYRPDLQAEIYEYLIELINNNPDLAIDHCSKSYVRFFPQEWDTPTLNQGEGWTPSGRISLFEFVNSPTSLRLKLYVGPGPMEIRQKLLDIALEHDPPFHSTYKSLKQKWNSILVRPFISSNDYETKDLEDLTSEFYKKWERFLVNEMSQIRQVYKTQDWIWNDVMNMDSYTEESPK